MSHEFPVIIQARQEASSKRATNAGLAFVFGSLAVMSIVAFPVSLPAVLSVGAFSLASAMSALVARHCTKVVAATHRFSELVESSADVDEIHKQLDIIFSTTRISDNKKVMDAIERQRSRTSAMSSRAVGGPRQNQSTETPTEEYRQEEGSRPPTPVEKPTSPTRPPGRRPWRAK